MQKDFHYFATYCAAYLAGYSHEECMQICYSAQFVDYCSVTFLSKVRAPRAAATTQLQLEMMDTRTDPIGLQDITRIWASFHFLPYDLTAMPPKRVGRRFRDKYRMICRPNGQLLANTVELVKGKSLEAVGVAMHVLADTWAHSYFAGTPSLVINNTDYHFKELLPDGTLRPVKFRHNPSAEDDLEKGLYTSSIFQIGENSIMNLGHGRAGHLPDYSFMRYMYLPAWGDYRGIFKDNPNEYYKAFCQMVYAMRYLRGEHERFVLDTYDYDVVAPYEETIRHIIGVRRLDACDDWQLLGEKLSGHPIEDFSLAKYEGEYVKAPDKDDTALGRFMLAAMAQKSMVTNRIFATGNLLAGFSVDMTGRKFIRGIRDYKKLVEQAAKEAAQR